MSPASSLAGLIGLCSYAISLHGLLDSQFHVVTYDSVPVAANPYWPASVFGFAIVAGIVLLAGVAVWKGENLRGLMRERRESKGVGRHVTLTLSQLWPLAGSLPVTAFVLAGATPPFWTSLVMIGSAAWAALRVGAGLRFAGFREASGRGHYLALGSLVLAIALLTVLHTRIQVNFFEHFMLGHSDIGHYAEELHNALAGRGLRSDSFDNTRLGWHFVPLMYVLVPLYALWPSPVMLMALGALIVHVVALPLYYLVRKLSGSSLVAWLLAAAWLVHPSMSRLVYANTYGFQWVYVAMPLIALMGSMSLQGRWRTCIVLAALVCLCQETTTALVFGWGVYLALFPKRRVLGALLIVGSAVYLVLCLEVFIPHFAAAGKYERFDLYGAIGQTPFDLLSAPLTQPQALLGRLLRREAIYFVALLVVTTALLPLRGWKIAVAAVPTLLMTLLLQNEQWLSIKFWYQVPVLPILFLAGAASMDRGRPRSRRMRRVDRALAGRPVGVTRSFHGLGLALLVASSLGHYFYGFSPISRPYAVYANATNLHQPDPRMEVVRQLRAELPKESSLLATERLAAHFTDYNKLFTGGRVRKADFVLIDRADGWDQSGLPQQADRFLADPQYDLLLERGSIVVFARRIEKPQGER